jgi:GTP-binding protein
VKTSPFDVIEAEFVGALTIGSDPTSLPVASAEVAFAGRSNVGKSSLINSLVQRKGLVRTSNTPGCTRQINFFDVKARDDARLVMVDLPGYGFAKRSKVERGQWADLIEHYLAKRPTLRVLVLLADARRGLEEEERDLLAFVAAKRASPLSIIVVATKFDKVPKSKAVSTLAKLRSEAGVRAIGFSAVDKTGWEELWGALRRALGFGATSAPTANSA